jgi:DNA repair protein RecN (Recombination protein N)
MERLLAWAKDFVIFSDQHAFSQLGQPAHQLKLLDMFCALEQTSLDSSDPEAFENAAGKLSGLMSQWRALEAEASQLRELLVDSGQKKDWLQFQLTQLEAIDPKAGEEEILLEQKKRFSMSAQKLRFSQECLQLLDGSGVVHQLTKLVKVLQALAQLEPALTELVQLMETGVETAQELSYQLGKIEQDCGELGVQQEKIQERLTSLGVLKRKFGPSFEQVLAKHQTLRAELDALMQAQGRLDQIGLEIADLRSQMEKEARFLSEKRRQGKELLEKAVAKELLDLQVLAQFTIQLHTRWSDQTSEQPEEKDPVVHAMDTMDEVIFGLKGSPSDQFHALAKVASGGEISRVLLALTQVLGFRAGLMILDEVDAGVGGKTAFAVGQKLRQIAKQRQVICITHLPQVAAFGGDHIVVIKRQHEGVALLPAGQVSEAADQELSGSKSLPYAISEARNLGIKDKPLELARMLAGPRLTPKALANAHELLLLAEQSV